MSYLGISRESGAIYIGESTSFAYRCATEPFLTPFRLAYGTQVQDDSAERAFNFSKRIFREVYFDPVTRVRRGDVFMLDGSQPARWFAQDPYRKDLRSARMISETRYETEVISYQHDPLLSLAGQIGKPGAPRVVLGADAHSTYWRILSIEASVQRVPVITLKAEQFYGDVPDLRHEQVPAEIRPNLDKLLDDIGSNIHRLSPVAVVDRCRDCLALIFGEVSGKPGADLSDAINAWLAKADEKENVRSYCGRIVARLHSRGKPNEQRSRNLRPLTESDAQLALWSLWTVLVEFGWAK